MNLRSIYSIQTEQKEARKAFAAAYKPLLRGLLGCGRRDICIYIFARIVP